MPSKVEGNKSLEKAIFVLNAFSVKQQKLGIQQLEHITKLPRATLYRIITPLLKYNYLHFDSATDKYSLGIKIYERSGVVRKSFELTNVLHHYLDKAKEEIGHTITVGVIRDNHIVQIDMREKSEGLKIGTYVGKITSPTYGLLGKVLLSYMPKDQSIDHIQNDLPLKWNGKSEYTLDNVYETLEIIKNTGYAISNNDVIEGVSGICFPIFNHSAKCIAALAILIPDSKFDEDEKNRCIKLGKRLTKNISTDMGYIG